MGEEEVPELAGSKEDAEPAPCRPMTSSEREAFRNKGRKQAHEDQGEGQEEEPERWIEAVEDRVRT